MALQKESLSHIISTKDPCSKLALNPHEKSAVLLDPALDYLSQFLLEEDADEDISGYKETALTDMEKPFYDILGEKYPPSLPDNQVLSKQPEVTPDFAISVLKDQVGPSYSESLAIEFQRGVEEGLKFLPNNNKLPINLQVSNLSLDSMKNWETNNSLDFKLGEKNDSGLLYRSKGKKSLNDLDCDLPEEGRSRKILMFSHEETIRDEMFDKILLYGENYAHEEIPELNANSFSENQNHYNNINLKSLLISCAQEVSINDNKSATHLIKQIRKQASPIGDGVQRLSWILVDGLEARLAGTGREIYRRLVARQLSATDNLKVHRMFIRSTSNNLRVPYHVANESILTAAGTACKIHVIDFGIAFGFQWPSLIQALAKRKGGPPTLRITGVDLPQSGFHPAERIKETGERLEVYARDFGVPLEYHGIAAQWESINIRDLRINNDEVLIVNSIYNFTRQRDEPLLDMNRSRNQLLNLIREIKPKIFIQGVPNLSFSPFFIPRFRMVFLQYSRIFDMLDTFIPRNSKSRQLMERELLGPTIINQIACEGSDLVAGLENYKQWHVRILQTTGFEQLPVDPRVVKECNEMVRKVYNEGFFIEEDCSWFLQGWKGNIMYAMSLWKPKVK